VYRTYLRTGSVAVAVFNAGAGCSGMCKHRILSRAHNSVITYCVCAAVNVLSQSLHTETSGGNTLTIAKCT
jgi:hypothetical protein